MTAIPPDRFVQLSTGQPGLRATIHTEIREPSLDQIKNQKSEIKNPDAILDFIASDESLDRYNEVISAAGWQLHNYQRNPVFQNAHQTGDILHTLGKALNTEVRGGKLVQTIEFACDVNPMARIAYGLYRGKFLNAVSVGFVPIRWETPHENSKGVSSSSPGLRGTSYPGNDIAKEDPLSPSDGDHVSRSGLENSGTQIVAELGTHWVGVRGPGTPKFRRRFLEQELLEVSAVAIPANPNALALGLKSGAVEKSDLRDVIDLFRSQLSSPSERSEVPISNRDSAPAPPPSTIHNQLLQLAHDFHRLLKS